MNIFNRATMNFKNSRWPFNLNYLLSGVKICLIYFTVIDKNFRNSLKF